jgi:type IV fimbrial biogenesis protein FimT
VNGSRSRVSSWAGCCRSGANLWNERQRGFSLIELMIGLVLVTVLMGIGVPMFRSFILDQRLRATSSDLRVSLTMARSEAIKRNRTIELQPNASGWDDGWTIPSPVVDGPDILNHKQGGDVAITGPAEVTFTHAGRVLAAAEFEIDVDPKSDGPLACMQLQLDGRLNSVKGACP